MEWIDYLIILVIAGDLLFNRLAFIKDLDVFGNINNKNFHDVLNNIAYKDENIHFSDEIEFRDPVSIYTIHICYGYISFISSINEGKTNLFQYIYLNNFNFMLTENILQPPYEETKENSIKIRFTSGHLKSDNTQLIWVVIKMKF